MVDIKKFLVQLDDDNDSNARKAFESVLRVSLLQPTSSKYHNFSQMVRAKAKKDYNYQYINGEEVSIKCKRFE
jgi:atrial natriuretic peptide receptor A